MAYSIIDKAASNFSTKAVVVANKDIAAGTTLTSGDLKEIRIPISALAPNLLTTEQLMGRMLSANIAENEQLTNTRVLAILVYLNTITDGGGTNFGIHDYSVEAEIGKIVVFPTNWTHPHMGLVPYSSDKWIISSFVTTNLNFQNNFKL